MTAPIAYNHQEARFRRGKDTSLAPIWMGRKKLPNMAGMPGTMKRKIMITPWRVNRALYVLGCTMVGPGSNSSRRMSRPMQSATRKKPRIRIMYRMPIRLWSVEKIQPRMPVRRPLTSR